MKRITPLFVLIFTAYTGLFAQDAQSDTTWAKPSPDIDYARQVVSTLCGPNMKGRGIAKGGDKAAADYILTEFRSIGVMPIGTEYFQKFPVNANTFPERMQLSFDKDKEFLKPGVDFLIDASSPTTIGEFKIIYISRKQMIDRMVLLDKLRDAKDGFILIDNEERGEETPDITKKLDETIKKVKTDMQVQIKGVIIYSKNKLTWNSSSVQTTRPIIYLTKEMNVSSLNTAKIAIDAEYKTNYETQNVVGIIEGSAKPDSVIVLTAHYDHLGMLGKDVIYPGANSNASGVAMLLSMAKHFDLIQPKYSVVFIALGGEELGLLGSQAYTNSPAIPLSKIKFLLNFDLVGTGVDGAKVVNGTVLQPKFRLLNDINGRNKYLPKLEPKGEACISGHCKFYQKQVPCFSVYTIGGTNYYHDLNDKPENLPLTEFENYQKLMIKFIESIR